MTGWTLPRILIVVFIYQCEEEEEKKVKHDEKTMHVA